MNIEVSKEDAQFLVLLLEREYTNTLIEMHHTKHNDFKTLIKAKEAQIEQLLGRFKNAN